MKWYAHRANEETGRIEKRITGVHGPFENIDEIVTHYSVQVLKWLEYKVEYTENYFRQLSNDQKGYLDFLIEHKHIFIFDAEPTPTDIQNAEKQL